MATPSWAPTPVQKREHGLASSFPSPRACAESKPVDLNIGRSRNSAARDGRTWSLGDSIIFANTSRTRSEQEQALEPRADLVGKRARHRWSDSGLNVGTDCASLHNEHHSNARTRTSTSSRAARDGSMQAVKSRSSSSVRLGGTPRCSGGLVDDRVSAQRTRRGMSSMSSSSTSCTVELRRQRSDRASSEGVPTRNSTEESKHGLVALIEGDDLSSIPDSHLISPSEDATEDVIGKNTAAEQHEPHEPLSYQIPQDVLIKALQTKDAEVPTAWSYNLYKGPDARDIPVHYCRKLEQSEEVAQLFANERVLGFDLEWNIDPFMKKNIKRNVSLIQLASEKRIALFHIALHYGESIDELVPPTLKKIMEDPNIIKCGVAIQADCTRLHTNLGIRAQSLSELSHTHKLIKYSVSEPTQVNRKLVSLKNIVVEHLGLPMSKGEVRTSSWERELNMEQLKYAASDAYAAVQLYNVLEGKRKALNPRPPRPYFAEEGKKIRLASPPRPTEESAMSDEDLEIDHDEDEGIEMVELDEDLEESQLRTQDAAVPASILSQLESATEELSLDKTSIPSGSQDQARTKPPATSYSKTEPSELVEANAWISSYLTPGSPLSTGLGAGESRAGSALSHSPNSSTRKSSPAQLRAYHLWHYQRLSVSQIAGLLRHPPLQASTVANYILQAVHNDKLEFDEDQMKILGSSVAFVPMSLKLSKTVGRFLQKP